MRGSTGASQRAMSAAFGCNQVTGMKKLLLKQTRVPAGLAFCLCAEDGLPLPGQATVTVESCPGDVVKATVVFMVGEEVEIVSGDKP